MLKQILGTSYFDRTLEALPAAENDLEKHTGTLKLPEKQTENSTTKPKLNQKPICYAAAESLLVC